MSFQAPEQLNGHKLMEHQRRFIELCLAHSRWGVFADTGTGKTAIGIGVAQALQPCRVLVVAPLALLESAWRGDCAKFAPQLPFHNLHAVPKGKRRLHLQRHKAGVFAINFEAFKSSFEDLAAVEWGALWVDESSKMKNPRSQITKALLKFAMHHAPRVYLASGTPAPNTELEYWAQGVALGLKPWAKSYWAWRGRVARPGGYMGKEWKVTDEGREQIKSDLAAVSWHVHKEDVLDLPERTFLDWHVRLSAAERRAYEQMKNHMVAEIMAEGGVALVAVQGVLPKLAKLRQATSGFMYHPDTKATMAVGDSKAKALTELLEEIGSRHQVIVWCHHRAEADQICQVAQRLGRKAVEYHGQIPAKAREANLRAFIDGEADLFVASPAAVAHGVTLVGAPYTVWFSLSYSYEQYHQANDRNYRFGQKFPVTVYHLIAPGTVDEVLKQCLIDKHGGARAVLDFLKLQTKEAA